MPVFKSLADFLINLSPRHNRPRSQERSAVRPTQPPPSTPPSRPARSGRQPLALQPRTENNDPVEPTPPRNADSAARPKVLDSYVNTFSSPPGSTTASERLHTRFSNQRLGSPTRLDMSQRKPQPSPAGRRKLMHSSFPRPGDSSPMLNKDKQKDSRDRQDEARLLGARYHDSQAVKIKPGATFLAKNKKPGASFAFSPQDKLSQNARSSGPVCANGQADRKSPLTRRKSPQLDHVFEESPRPSKKRRQSDTSEAIDLTAAAEGVMNRSEEGFQQSPINKRENRRYRHPESRDAENGSNARPQLHQFSSGDSRDERFMENAAQQRRNISKVSDFRLHQPHGGLQNIESESLDKDEIGTKKIGRNRSAFPSNRYPRSLNGRESPDELQGDITTHPIPKGLHGKQPQITRQPQVQVEAPTRKRSPADIRPTDFSSPPQDKKKARFSRKAPEKEWLSCRFRIGSFNKTCQRSQFVPIYSTKEGLELRENVLGRGIKIPILFQHFRQIFIGKKPSRKIRIQLLKGSVEAGDQLDLEFWETDEKLEFQKVLDQANVTSVIKDMSWMDRAFTKHESQFLQESKASKKRFLDEHADDSDPIEGSPTARRLKLSDSLRDSQGQLGSDRSRDIKRVAQNARKLAEESVDSRKISKFHKDHSVHSDTDAGADIPIKPLGSIADPPERETRSSTRRATKKTRLLHGDPGPEEDAAKPLFKDDPFRENWKEPLVYPPDGKKKAEVNLGDRDRLRTDDFLNDNLIAFYMRFLQDHLERTNPETAKRIYFFNSYFFATLAKDARTRGINYTGVEKWTRNVDLFSYDYIVVPINESAHWYVAVICNLPSLSLDSGDSVDAAQTPTLEKEISNVSEDQVHQIQETPEPELRPESGNTSGGNPANSDGQLTRTQMESETQKDPSPTAAETGGDAAQDAQNSREPSAPGELTGYDDNPPPLANLSKSTAQKLAQEHAAASQFKNNLKKKRSGLKLDPNQTTIITFDSLDAARSPTIRLLREYTCLEAASKRGVQLDPSEIKGMRARGIPLQPNFWDCGLYLLAYLEKFVQSPDYFITKVLQRSLSTMEDWPPLGSGLLRDRFGKFLDELYIEQKSADVPIMVDSFPVSFLLGPPLPSQEEIPGLDMVPESQPETDISKADDATAAESVKYQMDDSIADQTHLAPIEQFRNSNENTSNPSLDAAQQDGAVSLTKEEPEIQVPGSQEEPRLPDTPPRKKKERKRQISRNSLKE